MDIKQFIVNFEGAFEGLATGSIQPSTEFRKLEQWDSVTLLNILAMIDSEYDTQLNRAEIVGCKTIQDVFSIVEKKKDA
jgi:acyl carrier protein